MSLGDYEHTYRVVLEVTLRSKTKDPNIDRLADVGSYYGHDGVDIETGSVDHVMVRSLHTSKPQEVTDPDAAGIERLGREIAKYARAEAIAEAYFRNDDLWVEPSQVDVSRERIFAAVFGSVVAIRERERRVRMKSLYAIPTDGDMAQFVQDAQSLATRAVLAFEKSLSGEEA